MKMHNFNSGPAILPQEVLDEAANAIHNFNNTGLSVLEIGHRTEWFTGIITEAQLLVKELMQLNDEYAVLFLHGGATTQFMQVPMNLLDSNQTAAYCDNGIWGLKAIDEAGYFGNVEVAASSKDKNYSYIPKQLHTSSNAVYLHYTTNNTVEGTQWHSLPNSHLPLVADMSSDIFSRPFEFSKHALIYAGAQKNMGAAGVTLVVVNQNFLGKIKRAIPPIMDYKNHIKANSVFNTPPVFAVYVAYLTLKWIKNEGGLNEMAKRAQQRAQLFYDTLDALPLFIPLAVKEDRSLMNATFTIQNKELENKFLEACKAEGMVGVKGHRSVGGLRVSMYNALPISSVQALTQLMKWFAEKHS